MRFNLQQNIGLELKLHQNNSQHQRIDSEMLYTQYGDRLYSYLLYKMINEQDAQDVFHEAFIKIHKSLGSLDPALNYKAWCFKIVQNTMQDFFRRRRSESHKYESMKYEESAIHENTDIKESITTLVKELPAEQQEVIYMHYIMGFTFREIAELSELSINTISARARYALAKLRAMMEEENELR